MTIDHPAEQEAQDELEKVLDEVQPSGTAMAEDRVNEIHAGLNPKITKGNPFEIDAEAHAEVIAERAEEAVRKAANPYVDTELAESAGLEAGEEAYNEVLRLIREESPRLKDTSE